MWILEMLFGNKKKNNQVPALGIIPGKYGSDCFTPPQSTLPSGTDPDLVRKALKAAAEQSRVTDDMIQRVASDNIHRQNQ